MTPKVETKAPFFPRTKANPNVARTVDPEEVQLRRNDEDRASELRKMSSQHADVSIDDKIKDFSRIKRVVDAAPEPDMRMDKIAQLKQAISSGEYNVDYDGLAQKLIQEQF